MTSFSHILGSLDSGAYATGIIVQEAHLCLDYNNIAIRLPTTWFTRAGRPVITISRLSHILLIFSSEPPRNPSPYIKAFKHSILQDRTIFRNDYRTAKL